MIINYLDVLHKRGRDLERAFTVFPFKDFEIMFMSGLVRVRFAPDPEKDRWPAVWFPLKQTFDEFLEDHFPHDS